MESEMTITIPLYVVTDLMYQLDDCGVALHVEAVAPELRYSLLAARLARGLRIEVAVYHGIADDWYIGVGDNFAAGRCLEDRIRCEVAELDKIIARRGIRIKLGGRSHD